MAEQTTITTRIGEALIVLVVDQWKVERLDLLGPSEHESNDAFYRIQGVLGCGPRPMEACDLSLHGETAHPLLQPLSLEEGWPVQVEAHSAEIARSPLDQERVGEDGSLCLENAPYVVRCEEAYSIFIFSSRHA